MTQDSAIVNRPLTMLKLVETLSDLFEDALEREDFEASDYWSETLGTIMQSPIARRRGYLTPSPSDLTNTPRP